MNNINNTQIKIYWDNPQIKINYPSNRDVIQESFHNGKHCLFYDSKFDKNKVFYKQTLEVICTWANVAIKDSGIDGFIGNKINHYDIANLVKLNMWVDDIKKQGIVKPMLLHYMGNDTYNIGNGETRLRAIECIPSITTFTGFISTSVEHANKFEHLIKVQNFEEFASLCNADDLGMEFLFQLTDSDAPYGIWWYEYATPKTREVTPGEEYCVSVLHNYLKRHPKIQFHKEWFQTLINWKDYTE
jgi:hypothetical protein